MRYSIFQQRQFNVPTTSDDVSTLFLPTNRGYETPSPATKQPGFHADGTACFVPEGYEPSYAYPLVVWLHGEGGNEHELSSRMSRISTRNYLGLSLRGTLPAASGLPGGYRWANTADELSATEERLFETVRTFRRFYHVHSERIYLAGFAEGATLALRMLLNRPEWFAGAVALSGEFPASSQPLAKFRHLRGKQVLFGVGGRGGRSLIAGAVRTGRLLHTAGMQVSTKIYDAGREITEKMLTDVDHWIMADIATALTV